MFGGLFWGVFHWLQTRKSMRAFPIYSRKTTKWPFFSKVENFHEMMKNVVESRCTSHFCKISQKYIFNMDLPTLVSYKLNLSISAILDNVYQVLWPFEKNFHDFHAKIHLTLRSFFSVNFNPILTPFEMQSRLTNTLVFY